MPVKHPVHQINIKVDERDLKKIDAKAEKYGLSRSAMIKYFALNGEIEVTFSGLLRAPKK